jgi:hypothetical protein
MKLSRSALETLAIVAYRQPIIRPEIEEIRGVDSGWSFEPFSRRASKDCDQKRYPGTSHCLWNDEGVSRALQPQHALGPSNLKEIEPPPMPEETPKEGIPNTEDEGPSHRRLLSKRWRKDRTSEYWVGRL